MLRNVRAELVKQAHRPASWLLLAIAAVLTVTFAYLIPYAGLAGATSGAPNSDRGLAAMLPDAFVGNAIAGTPLFGGALAFVFGVLVVGSEYGWETWKTVLIQRPDRLTVYGAKIAVVAIGTLMLLVTLFAMSAGASALVATLEDQPLAWPGLAELARGFGAGWLITMMWALLGVALAVTMRAVALPIGLGLVWLLAVQNLLTSIAAPLLDWVAELQKWLPGPNAGSLVAHLGGTEGTPGIAVLVGSGRSVLVIAGYVLVFTTVGGWLLTRRDIV